MRLTDKNQIRSLLQRDPRWCVYAIGDLTPRLFDKCRWFTPDLTMVLHEYGTTILFAMGTGSIAEAIDEVTWPAHLQVREDALAEIARHAVISNEKHMWRMTFEGASPPAAAAGVTRLSMQDAPAIEKLYADGESTGESPDFFHPAMLEDGVFFGVREAGDLVAAAGTHLVARDEDVAAIGNIYVRRDRRGRGLGRLVTAAVLAELQDVKTIGLNVRADNAAAIHVYESLGFVKHCDFVEALAIGRHKTPASTNV